MAWLRRSTEPRRSVPRSSWHCCGTMAGFLRVEGLPLLLGSAHKHRVLSREGAGGGGPWGTLDAQLSVLMPIWFAQLSGVLLGHPWFLTLSPACLLLTVPSEAL